LPYKANPLYIKSHEKLCGKIKKIIILTYFT
jgi:hypothetical protein